jgi:hypothetical protein
MIKEMRIKTASQNSTTTLAHHFNTCGCHIDWQEYGGNFISSGVLLVLGYETGRKVIFLYADNCMDTAREVAGYTLDEQMLLLWRGRYHDAQKCFE